MDSHCAKTWRSAFGDDAVSTASGQSEAGCRLSEGFLHCHLIAARTGKRTMHFYRICGVLFRSQVRFPEFAPIEHLGTDEADVTITVGPLVDLGPPQSVFRTLKFASDGTVDWHIADYGSVRVSQGKTIAFEPKPGLVDVAQRSILLGPAQALLWAQRGRVALHASSVLGPSGAICIAGNSGAGKSVLAALLAERGHAVLADDMTVLSSSSDEVEVNPGYAALRLWDSVAGSIVGARRTTLAHLSGQKWYVRFPSEPPLPDRVPVSDLILLSRSETEATMSRASILEVMSGWRGLVHLPQAMERLGLVPAIGDTIRRMFNQGTRGWRLNVPHDLGRIRGTLDTILGRMAG